MKKKGKAHWYIKNGQPREVYGARIPKTGAHAYIPLGRGIWGPIFKTELFPSLEAAVASRQPKTMFILADHDAVECQRIGRNMPTRKDTGRELHRYDIGYNEEKIYPTRLKALRQLEKQDLAALKDQQEQLRMYERDLERTRAMIRQERTGKKVRIPDRYKKKSRKVARPSAP